MTKKKSSTLKVVMASGDNYPKKFRQFTVVDNPLSMDYEDIHQAGHNFMKYMAEHCSGTFVAGMRRYMLENDIDIRYGEEADDSDKSESQ